MALLYDDAERWGRLQVVLGHFNWFNVAVVTGDVAVRDRKRVLGQFARGEVQVELHCLDLLCPSVGSGLFCRFWFVLMHWRGEWTCLHVAVW